MREVAALYVRKNTVYYGIEGVDPWDVMRNARYFEGGMPVVAHPPCGQWGVLRMFARRDDSEKHLAVLAVEQIRKNGGVLEHPRGSTLWKMVSLPGVDAPPDRWGGYTIQVDQWRWGHKALKPTWLYIVGCAREDLPPIPEREGEPEYVLGTSKKKSGRPEIEKWEREATPIEFARWLVEVARRTRIDRP